ncbi:MAG: PucR family transcriptional regulator ligand-binding domain-containing protein, partial [Synergistaceae bacterium]|nr:PucR family transcriptional regulator ligand-binding domain-containing protein [Synergistaceae bacterium]
MTLKQMLERGHFSDFVIHAGGSGVSTRQVRTVCVADTLDVEGWLFGGEFLLTSGYIFKDCPERLRDFIEMSERGGAAGLGVKIGRFVERLPQDVIRTAERLNFPLIGIPFHYAHTDIIKTIIEAIAEERCSELRAPDRDDQIFLSRLLDSDSLEETLTLFSERIGSGAIFADTSAEEELRIVSGRGKFEETARALPLGVLIEKYPHEFIRSRPSESETGETRTIEGYLFTEREISDAKDSDAMMYAKKAITRCLRWENERRRLARGAVNQFVLDVLYKRFKHTSEIQNRARGLGWDMNGRHTVVFAGAANVKNSFVSETLISIMNGIEGKNVPCAAMEDGMAFILKTPEDRWARIKKTLAENFALVKRNAAEHFGIELDIGVGGQAGSLLSCDKSFREAKRIVTMAREKMNREIPYFWEDMGFYKLLSEIYDTQEARDFEEEHLGELISLGKKFK